MIFKIFNPAVGFAGVNYNEKKQKEGVAKRAYFENFGYLMGRKEISQQEFRQFLEQYSSRSKKIKKPQFHAALSCKGKEMEFEQLKDTALEIMKKLGYEGNPILIYEHTDTRNRHVHIVTSRVGVDGKKISDQFEKMRANRILNQIIQNEPSTEYQTSLMDIRNYKVSTPAQVALLMKQRGYQFKKDENCYQFFKHGNKQGSIHLSDINEQVKKTQVLRTGQNKIRALIYKYKDEYSGQAIIRPQITKTDAPTEFYSPLSDFLRKRFGLEFVYFSAAGKDKPYGYTVIDHKNKQVFKGSEIMKLGLMEVSGEGKAIAAGERGIPTRTDLPYKSDQSELKELISNTVESSISETFHVFEQVIEGALSENEAAYYREFYRGKRKRKRKGQQKR